MHLCNTTISKQLKISPDIIDTIDVAIVDTVGIVDDVETKLGSIKNNLKNVIKSINLISIMSPKRC